MKLSQTAPFGVVWDFYVSIFANQPLKYALP